MVARSRKRGTPGYGSEGESVSITAELADTDDAATVVRALRAQVQRLLDEPAPAPAPAPHRGTPQMDPLTRLYRLVAVPPHTLGAAWADNARELGRRGGPVDLVAWIRGELYGERWVQLRRTMSCDGAERLLRELREVAPTGTAAVVHRNLPEQEEFCEHF
jgi:hypothetical protein